MWSFDSRLSVSWKLTIYANSQAPPQMCRIRALTSHPGDSETFNSLKTTELISASLVFLNILFPPVQNEDREDGIKLDQVRNSAIRT